MGWRAIAIACTAAACSSTRAPFVGTLDPGIEPGDDGAAISPIDGACPPEGDAALCPELGGTPAWVGCTRLAAGTNTAALQSCTCFATETGEAAWACEVTDASPTPQEASSMNPPLCEPCVK